MFWSKSYPPLLLLDFDSTLTTKSTLSPLLSLPTAIFKSRPLAGSSNIPPPTADQLSAAYITDLETHKTSHPRTKPEGLIQEHLYQSSLRALEAASFERGRRAFAEAKVTRSDVHYAAFKALSSGEVVFRKGWNRLLATVAKKGRIGIISANWSKMWIEMLIEIAARKEGLVDPSGSILLDENGDYGPCGCKLNVQVMANEVVEDLQPPDAGAMSLRGGGEDDQSHEGSLTSGSPSRPKKRRKFKGSVDFGQPLILSPKAGRRHFNAEQPADTSVAEDHSDSSSSLSSLSSSENEATGEGKGKEREAPAEAESSDSSEGTSNGTSKRVLPSSEMLLGTRIISKHEEGDSSEESDNLEPAARTAHEGSDPQEQWRDHVSESDSEIEESSSESESDFGSNNIFVSGDKTLALDSMIRNFEKDVRNTVPSSSELSWLECPVKTIYIGDSTPDLDALMAADIGIVIRDRVRLKGEQLELKKTLKQLDISQAWIGDLEGRGIGWSNVTDARLWWAKDFDEVVDSGIFGIER